jgi:two-component system, cell cycle response regulator CtrA
VKGAMQILLISDDAAIKNSIKSMLDETFKVHAAQIGQAGVDLVSLQDYDLILLDLNGSNDIGLDVVKMLRASKIRVPFLVLHDSAAYIKIIEGLSVDECILKPIQKDELLAHIRARVLSPQLKGPSRINIGDLTIDRVKQIVEVAGVSLGLTAKEYQILEMLSLRKGTVLTKEMIFSNLYLGLEGPGAKIIDVYVCKLRKKMSAASSGKSIIDTVWGRGYMLREIKNEMPISA